MEEETQTPETQDEPTQPSFYEADVCWDDSNGYAEFDKRCDAMTDILI